MPSRPVVVQTTLRVPEQDQSSKEGIMRKLLLLLLIFSAMMFVSCGGGGGGLSGTPDQTPGPVSVTLNTSSVTLEVGDTFQFFASVNNATDTTITWTVNDVIGGNSTVGTMSVDGLYTAGAEIYREKRELTYRHIYDSYFGLGSSI
jgi:hypothetical protein